MGINVLVRFKKIAWNKEKKPVTAGGEEYANQLDCGDQFVMYTYRNITLQVYAI